MPRKKWHLFIGEKSYTQRQLMSFIEKFSKISQKNNSLLCVGLDIDSAKIPSFLSEKYSDPLFEFNKTIIEATQEYVCGYKLNLAFYEVLGSRGVSLLEKTIEYIPSNHLVILDGKRNDIGNTAAYYARSLFEVYHADAVTANPYLGSDSIFPFLAYADRCTFVLCRTSNPSAPELQNLSTKGIPLYAQVAHKIKEWNTTGTCGAVVGATYPKELQMIRDILGNTVPILIPGIGTQGGDIAKTVQYGTNNTGDMALIAVSRSIIYAERNKEYAKKAGARAYALREKINRYR